MEFNSILLPFFFSPYKNDVELDRSHNYRKFNYCKGYILAIQNMLTPNLICVDVFLNDLFYDLFSNN